MIYNMKELGDMVILCLLMSILNGYLISFLSGKVFFITVDLVFHQLFFFVSVVILFIVIGMTIKDKYIKQ